MQIDKNKVRDFFKKDHFAMENGIEVIDAAQGYAKTRVEVESRHLNGAGGGSRGSTLHARGSCLRRGQ